MSVRVREKKMHCNYGDTAKARLFMDGVAERRVVGSNAGTVHLCSENEFKSAEIEGREPIAIGFPEEDVSGIEAERVTTTD